MKITHLLTAAALASSAALAAQEGNSEPFKPYLALGMSLAHGHAHDLTQKTWQGLSQFAAEFGIEFSLPDTNVKMRPNFGLAKLLGEPPEEGDSRRTFNLMGLYIGFDIVYSPFERLPALSLTTGPSFHVWNVDELGAFGDPNQGDKGMKLGWRLGSTYKINEKFSATLDFAMTEWRKDKDSTVFVPGFNPSRPSYFTIKAVYHF